MRVSSLWVDFNETHDDDLLWTSLRNSPAGLAPEPGDWVSLYDDDGATCQATVVRLDGPIVYCKIDWSTWVQVRLTVTSSGLC